MKPGDVITVQYPNGFTKSWAVAGVYLGALGVESVVELVPMDEKPSGHGRTLCPEALLHVLVGCGGRVVIQEMEPAG